MAALLPPSFSQRDMMSGPTMAPPWLCGYNTNGEKFLYAVGLALDGLLEKMNEGMKAKCPGLSDESAIPFQAADRLLVQGPAETNPSFVLRLRGAFDAWSIAGSRAAVLEQVHAYLSNLQPDAGANLPESLVVGGNDTTTSWHIMYNSTPQGVPPTHIQRPVNWEWGPVNKHWESWLVLFMRLVATGINGTAATIASTGGSGVTGVSSGFATITGLTDIVAGDIQNYLTVSGAASIENNGTFQIVNILSPTSVIIANPNAVAPDANDGSIVWSVGTYPYIGPAPVWGAPSFVWGTDHVWGIDASPLVIDSIRSILKRWKASNAFYTNIIIAFDSGSGGTGTAFSPNSTQGFGNPDGTWEDIGKASGGTWIPAKTSIGKFDAFCDGTGLASSCYEKNIT